MTKDKALELALEALEHLQPTALNSFYTIGARDKAITAIKQALAAPVQDELAYREAVSLATWLFKKHFAHEEHYASGRVVWEPCDTTAGVISQIDNMVCGLVQPAPVAKPHEQEPIAYLHQCGKKPELKELSFKKNEPLLAAKGYKAIPLTSPPAQRKPLTDEEIWREYRFLWPFHPEEERKLASDILEFARAIEAKLKEKNNG